MKQQDEENARAKADESASSDLQQQQQQQPHPRRKWSQHEATPLLAEDPVRLLSDVNTTTSQRTAASSVMSSKMKKKRTKNNASNRNRSASSTTFLYYIIYAFVNVIISVPGLYGYAAVIFNNPIFANHMNALSKLVIFSSLVHQLSFVCFSSMSFAIGTVQDAGLIFLSSMANSIANRMLNDGDSDGDGASEKAIVSTAMVLLSLGTALLGICLIAIGKFKIANAVSYLPMPVVGGYLAFIGYFCVQAGVALCISRPLVSFADWAYLANPVNILLAVPGLVAGGALTWISRSVSNDAVLPLAMVAIPALFYVIIYAIPGYGLEGAREDHWVGDVAPPVPFTDLFQLVDFSLVRWDLVGDIIWTWVGMVFVVSFASCLDVAAISMDKGEALDTNRELATVGIGNLMSGLTFGFTGSYIFSQTIFTYRTGVHSRWIGVFIMVVFLYIVISPVNILQVAPLFFLGSTLIFIGYDLLYEWLIEIRPRVLLSEYLTIWGTFIAIQFVGVDFGIIVGALVAIIDNVVATAQTTTVRRVYKRSRAVWIPSEYKILQDHGYHSIAPKIVTVEITGPVFFGNSMALLDKLFEEVGMVQSETEEPDFIRSPHTSSSMLMNNRRPSLMRDPNIPLAVQRPPQFCVIDLSLVSNMDASAARTCFLQFSTTCSKRGIVVCLSCATPRIDWILRSHGVAYSSEEEERVKARIQSHPTGHRQSQKMECERVLMFLTIHEALEFCESALIHQLQVRHEEPPSSLLSGPREQTLSSAFARILDCSPIEREHLESFDGQRYHEELSFNAGERIFAKGSHPNSFYVVLAGAVAADVGSSQAVYQERQTLSGAGLVRSQHGSRSNLFDPAFLEREEPTVVATLWPVGCILGYTDMLLERPRTFSAIATQDGTRVARISRSDMNLLAEDAVLSALVHRVLLRASILDLQNCTCSDV